MKNFDGFAQIPRPLAPPLSNDILLQSKKVFFNYIKNEESMISIKKNKILFDRTKNISDLDYYTSTIASNIAKNKKGRNKNIVLKKIVYAINNDNLNKKEIHSLKKFKHNLLINSANVINSKTI